MQSGSADVSLTDLCAICHVNPIKYTCPRDGTHTCSLPCVKRHKQWAQCSGVRDPAEYRKRSELATPASIDKDYNFITKVERSLLQTDGAVADRGIDLAPARLRPHDTRPKFELEAEARGIKIIKAPKGLSRSKQNKTHWGGQSKCIVWSVEWICQDGRRLMSAAPEVRTVKELFEAASENKRHTRKRKRPSDINEQERSGLVKSNTTHTSVEEVLPREEAVATAVVTDARSPDISTTLTSNPPSSHDHASTTNPESDPLKEPPEQFFYLHRPDTESRFKCLISVCQTSSLQECLNNKTFLEYPTIYVRNEPPGQLQPPFLLEEEYIRKHGVKIPIGVTVPDETEPRTADLEEGEVTSLTDLPPGFDETKVLEVLAKDLGS